MFISDILRTKGHHVVRIHTVDSVELAVRSRSIIGACSLG